MQLVDRVFCWIIEWLQHEQAIYQHVYSMFFRCTYLWCVSCICVLCNASAAWIGVHVYPVRCRYFSQVCFEACFWFWSCFVNKYVWINPFHSIYILSLLYVTVESVIHILKYYYFIWLWRTKNPDCLFVSMQSFIGCLILRWKLFCVIAVIVTHSAWLQSVYWPCITDN